MSTDPITEVADRFARETKNHTMTVLRDDGLYRHLRFKAPDNGFYWFDLITWPGYLTFVGDGEGYVFTRIEDMFGFFRGGRINPQYWAEKVVDGRGRLKTYSEERFRQLVTEHLDQVADDYPAGLREAVQEILLDDYDVVYEDGARTLLSDFTFTATLDGADEPVRYTDVFVNGWEWDLTDWDFWYLWACTAIQWGIAQYDVARAPALASAAAECGPDVHE